jgi:endo-1,3-1,4-beta-glycanase ExoK
MKAMLKMLSRGAFALAAFAATTGVCQVARAQSSAEFYTLASYHYGRFRARVQFPAGDGVVGSFFLWKDGSEMANVFWNELDYEKIKADCSMQLNSFYGLPKVEHASLATGLVDLCVRYHTYAYEWTPDHIAWSVDDVEVRRDTGADAQAFADQATQGMQFRFNLWPDNGFGGTFSATALPTREYVSWVEYAAYTPGAGDAGGDFNFAWRESFEQGIPAGWAEGNWASDQGLSTHSPANVTVVAGVAVLSLTASNATGFFGAPPVDDGDLPSQRGPLDAGVSDGSAVADRGPIPSDATLALDAAGDTAPADAPADASSIATDVVSSPADASSLPIDVANDVSSTPAVDAADDGVVASNDDAAFADVTSAATDSFAPPDSTASMDSSPNLDSSPPNDVDAPALDATALDAAALADASSDASSSVDAGDGSTPERDRTVPSSGCGCRIASPSARLGRDRSSESLAIFAAALAIAGRRLRRPRRS